MADQHVPTETKSAERLAFELYLRTGRRVSSQTLTQGVERKFNPYHDPRNGRFTFAPGGPRSLRHVVISDRRGLHLASRRGFEGTVSAGPTAASGRVDSPPPIPIDGAVYRPGEEPAILQQAQYRPNPRARSGGNGPPRPNDPLTLEAAFPGLANAPGGALVALADNILDLTGPANRLTTSLAQGHVNMLIRQIQAIDPSYRLASLGFPTTLEGQANLISDLRLDRAVALYRAKGDIRLLQVETLRKMQKSADRAYDEGQRLFEAGRLQVRLSREEAVGNFVDRAVRRELRGIFNFQGIDHSRGQQVRVAGREYDTSGTDAT